MADLFTTDKSKIRVTTNGRRPSKVLKHFILDKVQWFLLREDVTDDVYLARAQDCYLWGVYQIIPSVGYQKDEEDE